MAKMKKPAGRTTRYASGAKHVKAPLRTTDRPATDAEPVQGALLTDEQAPAKALTSMEFHSADEALSVAHALSGRADDLTKEAKKLSELGKLAESRNLLREAKHIEDTLLPQVRQQGALPFNAAEPLTAAVSRVVGQRVRTAVVRAMKTNLHVGADESYDEILAQRGEELAEFERVIGHIAEQSAAAVLPFIREAAERGYNAGLSAREQTPEAIAREAVQVIAASVAA